MGSRHDGTRVVATIASGRPRSLVAVSSIMSTVLQDIQSLHPRNRKTLVIAIDGYGGSGKSTVARNLAGVLSQTTIVRTDDFARPNTPSWDWPRLKEQVLDQINRDQPGRYQRYDWNEDRLAEWHTVPTGGVLIVEGVSSMRRELGEYWDYAIWVACSYELRLRRGIERDGASMRSQWIDVWMPEEDKYVREQRPGERADTVVSGEAPFRL
jgi:uridine kinase